VVDCDEEEEEEENHTPIDTLGTKMARATWR
jgi:hypothetical protein